jgi:hypothetical protein
MSNCNSCDASQPLCTAAQNGSELHGVRVARNNAAINDLRNDGLDQQELQQAIAEIQALQKQIGCLACIQANCAHQKAVAAKA